MSIRLSPQWANLLAEQDFGARMPIEDDLLTGIGEPVLDELVDICDSGSRDEQYEAMRLLTALRRSHDPRMNDPARLNRWLDAAQRFATTEYPRTPLGTISFGVLRADRPAAADTFLTSELDVGPLSDGELRVVVRDLRTSKSPSALDRMRSLAGLSDERGAEARRALEKMGPVSEDRLEDLFREWRSTRSSAALNRLWVDYISRVSYLSPAAALLARLGEPSNREGTHYWYEATDSNASLLLAHDDQGRLVTWKLSG
jgi:hypothetical protein